MSAALTLYRAVSPLLAGAVPLLAPFHAKLRAGHQGRRGLEQRLLDAAPTLQGCLWIHAASVGEFMQGMPLIAATRRRLGQSAPPVAATHFSPSGLDFAVERPCADLHDYLPLDTPGIMERVVRAWRPRALVFMSGDVWPNLAVAAHREGVPLVLLAGSLPPDSERLTTRLGAALYRDVFDRFTHLGVNTEDDRRRFVDQLGVRAPVTVTGNTRVEQVIVRYEESAGGRVSARLQALGGRMLVLGSTWRPDEDLWLPVLPDLLERFGDLRVVVCPHEPHPEVLTAVESRLTTAGITVNRLSDVLDDPTLAPRVVLVDSVGVLAEIYRAGALAHVGGAFTTGVHNTMEPAVAGLPVICGPSIQNAEEAGDLVRAGAAWVCREPHEALARATELLGNAPALEAAGRTAREVVLDQRGATDRSMQVLLPLLTQA